MRANKLRRLLDEGKPTVGTHIHSSWPSVVEAVGHTGMFDYVEFVAEYAPFDLFSLDNFCRAAELHDLSAMIKVDQEPQRFLAQRAVGAGFQSVLFADSHDVEEARRCVLTVRPDTPDAGGSYGAASRRNAYMAYGGGSSEYVQALKDIVVVLMIEKKTAVEQLDQILELDGVDMIQWGGSDYSMSVGRPGASQSREVKEVERRVIETCLRRGVPPRAEIESPDAARYYLDLGVRHFSIGTDLMVVHRWMRENGENLRKVISEQ